MSEKKPIGWIDIENKTGIICHFDKRECLEEACAFFCDGKCSHAEYFKLQVENLKRISIELEKITSDNNEN